MVAKNIRRLGHDAKRHLIGHQKVEELNENFGFMSCHLVPTNIIHHEAQSLHMGVWAT